MAALKFILSLLLVALATQVQMGLSQNCANELNSLNVCAPFVVPGSSNPNPSTECCNAMRDVDQTCYCNTMRIISRLPTQCNMPSLTC
ncbi:protein MEN-8-like [Macadamia integrifolia]|uniref:protein MEN-8-like n=1 Tax=Macadamia integrifolia TaxID=60698 RepID=UPI001C4EFD51|nr:protein MEN-8-like [Macadamia integrifolia]